MNTIILKSFLCRLGFVSNKIEYSNSTTYDIILEKINNNEVEGTFLIKNNQTETIKFNTKIIESDDILIFKSKYQTTNCERTEIDTFVIVNQETKSYFTPKTKYLIHLVGDRIEQAYIVNKKYKFINGINENYSRINMDNKEIINEIRNYYEHQITNKKR